MDSTFYVQWHITDSCNLRCRHCYQDETSKEKELDWAGLKGICDRLLPTLHEWDRGACIHVTGGEPLLKPELFPLLQHLDRQAIVEELGIITNGVFLDGEMAGKLAGIGKLKTIKISLDGGDPETNDSIRSAGSFESVMRNLPAIAGGERFQVFLMFTAMKTNYRNLPSLISLARDSRASGVIIERFVPWGRGRAIRGEVLEKSQWKEMVESLYDLFEVEPEEDGFNPYQAFQVDFRGRDAELKGAPCVIGEDGLCVMPDGTVFPCRRFPVSIGSLRENSLKEIWEESGLLASLRQKHNLEGKCGRCAREGCTGCRSLAYALTGDFFAEDPHCFSD
jgi:radical SAM protein with 4Fe4S-binding SPASM domain